MDATIWSELHPVTDRESIQNEEQKDEKINGQIYRMSPAPDFRHGIVNSNIHTKIKSGLKDNSCLVSIANLDFKYHPQISQDYVCPDVMIVCDRNHLKGGSYDGIPRFVAETVSPSTAKRDKTEKKDIYEKAGVEEYWIVSPQGMVDIYYLNDGTYSLEYSYMLQSDKQDVNYHAEQEICLQAFPHIKMTLGEIFEGVY